MINLDGQLVCRLESTYVEYNPNYAEPLQTARWIVGRRIARMVRRSDLGPDDQIPNESMPLAECIPITF